MSAPVVFVPADFRLIYPTFATLSDAQLVNAFQQATLYVDNGACSIVPNDQPAYVRQQVLYQVTAHVAKLLYGENGQPPTPLVGRINSAGEGSVNVSTDMGPVSGDEAWWVQTPYGALAWQALAPYRRGLYIAAPQAIGAGYLYGLAGYLPFTGGRW